MRHRNYADSAESRTSPARSGTGSLPTAPDVRCSGLGVTLDNHPVLCELNLRVPAGSITALVGASGSGKSTLIKHLLGLLAPDEGAALIGDQDVMGQQPRAVA